jgi:putative NADH-flavin reductase
MRIAIFGATGSIGRHVVDAGLQGGHELSALVRDPARLPSAAKELRIVRGDVRDLDAVQQVLDGADAVIAVLGQRQPITPGLLQAAARNIVAAMRQQDVGRLVWVCCANVWHAGDERGFVGRITRGLTVQLAAEEIADAQAAVQAIEDSRLEWTVVRVPHLTDDASGARVQVRLDRPPDASVGRNGTAGFLIAEACDGAYVRQMPFIGA